MAYNPFTAVQTQQSLLDALSKGEFGRKIGTIKKEERIIMQDTVRLHQKILLNIGRTKYYGNKKKSN